MDTVRWNGNVGRHGGRRRAATGVVGVGRIWRGGAGREGEGEWRSVGKGAQGVEGMAPLSNAVQIGLILQTGLK